MLPLFEPPPPAEPDSDRMAAMLARQEAQRLARNLPPALLAALCEWRSNPHRPSAGDALFHALTPYMPALQARLNTRMTAKENV